MMLGIPWEMKSPEGGSKTTMKHTVENALEQSNNIIVDLQRCKLNDDQAIKDLERQFKLSRRLRRMKIITKDREILDFHK